MKEAYELLSSIPLKWKIGIAVGVGLGIRKLYNPFPSKIDSMHSGRDYSMSAYSNTAMNTDFGSGWKGLNKNISRLSHMRRNAGLGSIIKKTMTSFDDNGVNIGKTMMKVNNSHVRHKWVNIKDRIYNPVLDLHDKRNIGHIIG